MNIQQWSSGWGKKVIILIEVLYKAIFYVYKVVTGLEEEVFFPARCSQQFWTPFDQMVCWRTCRRGIGESQEPIT